MSGSDGGWRREMMSAAQIVGGGGPLDEPRGHNPSEDLDLKYNKTKNKQITKNIIKYLTT